MATIESIGSSTRIEGSKLSDREVEQLLSKLQIKTFTTRDEQEVASYAEVMDLVFASWQDITLTENHIRQLHRDLLVHNEKDALGGSTVGVAYGHKGPFTILTWAQKVRADLQELANIKSTAVERNAIATAPGVFGPLCRKHDTTESNEVTFLTTVGLHPREGESGLKVSAATDFDGDQADTAGPVSARCLFQ